MKKRRKSFAYRLSQFMRARRQEIWIEYSNGERSISVWHNPGDPFNFDKLTALPLIPYQASGDEKHG